MRGSFAYVLVFVHLTCVLAKEYGGAEMASPPSDGREPSCEELRAMWRFSKRQSRATEITNEIPTYRDPFAYNVWIPYASSRSAGAGAGARFKTHVYGRPVFEVPRSREMARLFGAAGGLPQGAPPLAVPRKMHTAFRLGGGGALSQMSPQSGSFQHLQKLIRAERARELEQQRVAEEAAARHAALSHQQHQQQHQHQHQQATTYFGRMVQDPAAKARPAGLVAFPDLLAPPLRYAHPEEFVHLTAAHLQDNRHRSLAEPMSRSGQLGERGFFHH